MLTHLSRGRRVDFALTQMLTQNRKNCCGDSGAQTMTGLPNRLKRPAESSGKRYFAANGSPDERS